MKFRSLIFANLFRKKTRFLLTIGSFTMALFLFGILAAVKQAFSGGIEAAGADRLVVINRTSLIQTIPLSYRDRILRIPGVKIVTFANWFGGIYQDKKNAFGQFAIDVENHRKVFAELVVPDDQWENFVKDRQGAVVGIKIAKRFGWKVGDRIPLRGTIFQGTWEFNIDGIYRGTRHGDDETQFWFQRAYLEEHLPDRLKGQIGWYTVKIANPEDAPRIIKAIDDEFANSPFETRTNSEKSFMAGWLKQMGNIEFLILSIGSVVFFTLLLVTGNTMAIAVRERTSELAVLKAVGYSDRFVLLLVLTESLVIAVFGGGLGLGLSKLLSTGDPTGGFLPVFSLPVRDIIVGFMLALMVGIASGLFPALGAMRLRVVEALRRV
jgi:putative ABC transport system permease protein